MPSRCEIASVIITHRGCTSMSWIMSCRSKSPVSPKKAQKTLPSSCSSSWAATSKGSASHSSPICTRLFPIRGEVRLVPIERTTMFSQPNDLLRLSDQPPPFSQGGHSGT